MTQFGGWIMSIVGGICLTTLIELVLQDDETKKYVKGIVSIIIFTIILAPIPKILTSNNDTSLTYSEQIVSEETTLNDEFLYKISEKQYEIIKNNTLSLLEERGYENIDINILLEKNYNPKIIAIIVNLEKVVINNKDENIDIVKEIKSCIATQFNVDDQIVQVIG